MIDEHKVVVVPRENKNGTVYRVIVRYVDEYGKTQKKEKTYYPKNYKNQAKNEAEARLEGYRLESELKESVEIKRKQMNNSDWVQQNMNFRELADRWLKFKVGDGNGISENYRVKAISVIEMINTTFGDMKVRDITTDKIQEFYLYLDKLKKKTYFIKARPNAKEIIKSYGIGYRELINKYKCNGCSLSNMLNFKNISKQYASELSEKTGIPFDELFEETVVEELYAPGTTYQTKKIFRTILMYAQNVLKIISDNPACNRILNYNNKTQKGRESLTKEMATVFFTECLKQPIYIKVVMILGLMTGIRPEEIGGLQWKDIDFAKGTIRIRNACIRVSGKGIILKETKTKKERLIPLTDIIEELLQQYKIWQDEQITNLGDLYEDDDKLFMTEYGGMLCADKINKWFKKIIKGTIIPEHFSMYNLRHTAISLNIDNGTPINVVSSIAGHTSTKTTEKFYIHTLDSSVTEAMNRTNDSYKELFIENNTSEISKKLVEMKKVKQEMEILGIKSYSDYLKVIEYKESLLKGKD